jgi:hypothetical protein
MRHWILAALLVLALPISAQAQPISMRFLAADQIFIYGQAIFDRKDYYEAANAFSRLLWLNPAHKGGLYYAKELLKMGYRVFIPDPSIPLPPKLMLPYPAITGPNEDLKEMIRKADESIAQLKVDITDINSQISQTEAKFQEDKAQLNLK